MENDRLPRRNFIRSSLGAAVVLVGCAPGPSQKPVPEPAGKTPAVADEWNQVVEAAKKEGKVSYVGLTGTGYRNWLEEFSRAYPGIEVQHRQFSSTTQFGPLVLQERKAGLYEWDLLEASSSFVLPELRPAGVLAPLKPLLTRQESIGDQYWRGGLAAGWLDKDKQLGYAYTERVAGLVAINTDLVRSEELQSVDDLLNTKWKGKIFCSDVRNGGTFGPMSALRERRGEEVVKRLIIDQSPTFNRDTRQITEALVRGTHAIGFGATKVHINEFQSQGLGRNIKFIDIPDISYISYSGTMWLIDKAPHPNAARVFANWILSESGQRGYSRHLETSSRRNDVPPYDPAEIPIPGRQYMRLGPEEGLTGVDKTKQYLLDLLGLVN